MRLYQSMQLIAARKLWRDAETEVHAVCVEIGRPEWDWQRIDWLRRLRPAWRSDQARTRKFREGVDLATNLCHQNIVQVFAGYDLEDGDPVQHTESVNGHNLAVLLEKQRITGEPIPPRCVSQIMCDAEVAVRHAHEKGVVHGGFGAHEIWVTLRDGLVKVAGFGVRGVSRDFAHEDQAALARLRAEMQAAAPGTVDHEGRCSGVVMEWALRLGGPNSPTREFAAALDERHAGLPEGSGPNEPTLD